MIMWRFRGFDRAELSPLLQGAVLKEKVNVQPSIFFTDVRTSKKKKKKTVKGSSPEEACLCSLGLNGCCEALAV